MAKAPFKTGLFARMLTLCVLTASLCAALVTFAFYSYREALTTNRLATPDQPGVQLCIQA